MPETYTNSLAPYTSLRCGGGAEQLIIAKTRDDVIGILAELQPSAQFWMLGFGSNCLISDQGLPGTTVVWRGGDIWRDETVLIADAGVWWDDLVRFAIDKKLWGLELTSEIPSSVGGAVFGNIAAYGQQVSDTLLWVEVYDRSDDTTKRLMADELTFAYRESSLQSDPSLVILQAAFELSETPTHTLRYDAALSVARELEKSTDAIGELREVIIETRRRAGSLYHPDDPTAQRTAGSFFKNPLVTLEQARAVAAHDETGRSLQRIEEQNKIHGGSSMRASAAHVLLAAGFTRGQTWQNVRLHPDHVLKLETLPGATSSEVFGVAQEIVDTVRQKLDITIVPEVRFLGEF